MPMTSATRIRFVGSLALAVALVQVAVYLAWRLGDGTLGWFLLDPRLGISAWTDSTGVPGVAAWLSVAPLALSGLALRRSPSPFTLKAYMGIESALAAPSVAFFALVIYENLGSAHGFSIRELPHPTESDLVGQWVSVGSRVQGNGACARIEWLVSQRFERLGSDETGWDTLFRDPRDGRLWELTYPQSHMHGGGPPRLTVIAQQAAAAKYRQHGLTRLCQ